MLQSCVWSDAYTIMLSKGALLWERSFHAGDATEANSIRETSDGGYILAGYAMAYEGRDDMWIIKLNENGEIMK